MGVGQYGLNFMRRNLLQHALKFLIFNNLTYSFDFFRFKKTLYNPVDRFSFITAKSENNMKGVFASQFDIIQTERSTYIHITILKLLTPKKQTFIYDTALRLKFFYTDTLRYGSVF